MNNRVTNILFDIKGRILIYMKIYGVNNAKDFNTRPSMIKDIIIFQNFFYFLFTIFVARIFVNNSF